SLRVPPHARRTHFVNAEPGRIVAREGFNVAAAGRGQHFRRGDLHILADREFVFAPRAAHPEHRNSPGIGFFRVEFHEIIVTGQELAEAADRKPPGTGPADRLLEISAQAGLHDSSLPSFAPARTLIAVSPQEGCVASLHVTKSRNINPVRTTPDL